MANEPEKIPASKYSSSRQFVKPDLPVLPKIVNAPQTKPDNGGHYCVLCNLPNGLICAVDDKRIKLKGSANYLLPSKTRKFKGAAPHEVIFGATMNFVDKDFWDKWVAQMTDREKYPSGYGPIINGQIMWHQQVAEATLIRKESERVKSGFEQLNPEEHGVKRDDDAPATGSVPRITE